MIACSLTFNELIPSAIFYEFLYYDAFEIDFFKLYYVLNLFSGNEVGIASGDNDSIISLFMLFKLKSLEVRLFPTFYRF